MVDQTESLGRELKTLTNGVTVVNALRELDRAGVSQIATHCDISKSSAHNYLATLQRNGWVIREGEYYRLSLEFLLLGEYVRKQHSMYSVAKPEVDRLVNEINETVHVATEQRKRHVVIYKREGEYTVGKEREYHQTKEYEPSLFHQTATGKAILAHLPREEVHEIIDAQGLPAKTKNTITDVDTLFEELDRIREQGFSLNDQEEIFRLRAVGAPILDQRERVLGSLSVSGPVSRLRDDYFRTELPKLVMDTASNIEIRFQMENRMTQSSR